MEGLSEGRIVHFVLVASEDDMTRVCRPAIIVNAHDGFLESGKVNLQVFFDGPNDGKRLTEMVKGRNSLIHVQTGMYWFNEVKYSEGKEKGTWHWPERA